MSQGEIETQGSFEDVSRSSLFVELLEEEQPEDVVRTQQLRQRTTSIQVFQCFS